MRYNIRKWNPWLISIPDLSVGMFGALTGIIAPRQRLGEYQGLLNLFISLPQFLVMIIMGELIDRGLASYLYPIATIMAVLAVLIMIPKLNAQTEEQASPVEHEAQQ